MHDFINLAKLTKGLSMGRVIVLLVLVSVVSGCATTVRTSPYVNMTHEASEKDYQISQLKESYVGNPMIVVKRKTVETKSVMVAPSDFSLSGGIISLTGKAGDSYPIIGTVLLDGKTFYAIAVDSSSGKVLLVDDNGRVHSKVLNSNAMGGYVVMFYDFQCSPQNFTFKKIERDGYTEPLGSYELIYDGTDGLSFSLTYREYTAGDMARPAFTQNLKYQKSQNKIRFKNLVISVEVVDNEKIRFAVISDS